MKKILILSILAFYATSAFSQASERILGVWWNDEKTSKIEITQEGEKFFGTIVYMIPEKYENGEPPKDDENPDPALRDRSIVGLQILKDFTYDAKSKEWGDGTIYDPKSGKTYDCYGWMESDDELKLKGYVVGIKWLGKKTSWSRTTL